MDLGVARRCRQLLSEFAGVDLTDTEVTAAAVSQTDPELVTHMGAKSHMDRLIEGPASLIYSKVSGTFQLLIGVLVAGEQLACECQIDLLIVILAPMRFTAAWAKRVAFGNYALRSAHPLLGQLARQRPPAERLNQYFALPLVLTNCFNNYALAVPRKNDPCGDAQGRGWAGEPIPLYSDGQNLRGQLCGEYHIDALLLVAFRGAPGRACCERGGSPWGAHQ